LHGFACFFIFFMEHGLHGLCFIAHGLHGLHGLAASAGAICSPNRTTNAATYVGNSLITLTSHMTMLHGAWVARIGMFLHLLRIAWITWVLLFHLLHITRVARIGMFLHIFHITWVAWIMLFHRAWVTWIFMVSGCRWQRKTPHHQCNGYCHS